MDKSTARAGRPLASGHTLIELIITLAVMAFVSGIVFQGLRSFYNGSVISLASKQYLSDLRSLANKVNYGANGVSLKTVNVVSNTQSYSLDSGAATVDLSKQRVTITTVPAGNITLCFANPNLLNSPTHPNGFQAGECGGCGIGKYFACNDNGATHTQIGLGGAGQVTFTFSGSGPPSTIIVEGNGNNITRMYAQ